MADGNFGVGAEASISEGGGVAPSDPGGSANINLPNVPVKKKKKPTPLPPITPPAVAPPPPTPVSQEVAAFKQTLLAIVEKFAISTAAIAPPPAQARILIPQ